MLPPTWNTDCAKPYRPPEARRATRDDSGWNTAEPSPTMAAPRTSIDAGIFFRPSFHYSRFAGDAKERRVEMARLSRQVGT